MRQRSFEIIRTPDQIGSSFLFNNVLMRYVATHPEAGISFYVNDGKGGVVGLRIYPDGRKVLENAMGVKHGKTYSHGREEYLQFKHAFGLQKGILASHAVYIAWRNKEIPAGMTIDHIDGVTTNNDYRNLRCVSNDINNRDGGFLRKLRNKGFNPGTSSQQTGGVASAEKGMCIPRWMLLRYYQRMARIKAAITKYRYEKLTKEQLRSILFLPDEELQIDSLMGLDRSKAAQSRKSKSKMRSLPSLMALEPKDLYAGQ